MDKDFAYGLRGFTMAIIFLASIKFISSAYTLYFLAKTNSIDSIAKQQPPYFFVKNERGKKLYEFNCSTCHAINKTCNIFHLETIEERVVNCDLLYEFIRNSQQVIESGEPYFVQLYKDYNEVSMAKFPNLTTSDIDDILEYIHQAYENERHHVSSVQ